MSNLRTLSEMKSKLLSSKKAPYLFLGILIGLILLFMVRSCVPDFSQEISYKIGQDTRWQDILLLGKQRNLVAFNQDLLTVIGKRQNLKIKIYPIYQKDLIKDLEQQQVDGILTTLFPSPNYESRFLFSEPYFLTGPVLIIPESISLDEWNKIPKKIIGTYLKVNELKSLSSLIGSDAQFKFYTDILAAFKDLAGQKIDGAIFPAIPSYTYVKTFYTNELKIASNPLNLEGIRLVVEKNEKGEMLISDFNEGLKDLKESGDYASMLDRWGLINVELINIPKSIL